MGRMLGILGKRLDTTTRQRINDRTETLVRGIRFLLETRDKHLLEIIESGWPVSRLELICELNAFYQHVIGPLASSARAGDSLKLGTKTPILHGTMRVDKSLRADFRAMHTDFLAAVRGVGIARLWLQANHAADLVHQVWKTTVE